MKKNTLGMGGLCNLNKVKVGRQLSHANRKNFLTNILWIWFMKQIS